jgi:hypothetical protein
MASSPFDAYFDEQSARIDRATFFPSIWACNADGATDSGTAGASGGIRFRKFDLSYTSDRSVLRVPSLADSRA